MIGWNRGVHHGFTGEYVINNGRTVCLREGEKSSFGYSIQGALTELRTPGTRCLVSTSVRTHPLRELTVLTGT